MHYLAPGCTKTYDRQYMSENMDEALTSVERLAGLDVARTLCYHGGFVEAGSDRIAEIGSGSS